MDVCQFQGNQGYIERSRTGRLSYITKRPCLNNNNNNDNPPPKQNKNQQNKKITSDTYTPNIPGNLTKCL